MQNVACARRIGGEVVDEALMAAGMPVSVTVTQENTMSVRAPIFRVAHREEDDRVKRLHLRNDNGGQLDDVLDTFAEALLC